MTHEELLAKIATPNEFIGVKYAPDWQSAALRAVVELHKPVKVSHTYYKSGLGCSSPDCIDHYCEPIEYPCLTIRAIEKELK